MKKIIKTPKAPSAIGPYSQAISVDGWLYCSGQIGLVPEAMEFAQSDTDSDVVAQTKQVMENLKAVLQAGGASLSDVIKCSIYVDDMNDFTVINKIYGSYFRDEPPARETVAVETLPKNALVEISCIATVS